MPERVRLRGPRAGGCLRWGDTFRYWTPYGLTRLPAAVGDGLREYEGCISADGTRHDYHHADGRITVCHVRYMTLAEIMETCQRALTGDHTPSMRSTAPTARFLRVTGDDARATWPAGASLDSRVRLTLC